MRGGGGIGCVLFTAYKITRAGGEITKVSGGGLVFNNEELGSGTY